MELAGEYRIEREWIWLIHTVSECRASNPLGIASGSVSGTAVGDALEIVESNDFRCFDLGPIESHSIGRHWTGMESISV